MSKCLYTEADVTQSGAQLLINAISLDGKILSDKTKKFQHAFPEAWKAMRQMLTNTMDLQDVETDVNVGDVLWLTQGGNKYIGFCIVKKTSEHDINKEAIKATIRSTRNKAKELGIKYVGMDLFASETPQDWAEIVDDVEEALGEIQGVVCIPTNEELVNVMENLPGSKNFKMISIKEDE
jgi:hypothetical protein